MTAATTRTAEAMKAEERARTISRSLNAGVKEVLIAHLLHLRQTELEHLLSLSEPHKLHRAQGAVASLEKVLGLFQAPTP